MSHEQTFSFEQENCLFFGKMEGYKEKEERTKNNNKTSCVIELIHATFVFLTLHAF